VAHHYRLGARGGRLDERDIRRRAERRGRRHWRSRALLLSLHGSKVVHSLRHRAQDRLRSAGCPEDVRWAILGHEEKTVAKGYGKGFPHAASQYPLGLGRLAELSGM
jgi:hypothetical protein